jgi:2-(1,2-epoxy-1,2-dihydrophenyl)acetyl-CoA isomerase
VSYQTILFELSEGIARLTLNRPEKLNSFTAQMHAEIREALRAVAEGGARVLILTGAGRAFCSGQDLSERVPQQGSKPIDIGETVGKLYNPLVLGLRNLPMPVIAAVNGVAAGAGANVALACDLVIAARSASFVQAFSRIGLLPDCGGTWSLPRLVGQARALGLALLAEKLTAEQAAQWGLIWRCVEDPELSPTVEALAKQLAAGPTLCFARTKQAMYASWGNSLEAQLSEEREYQRELGTSDDFIEGVTAFMEKRAPRFTGR